jgi:hypothetical protein
MDYENDLLPRLRKLLADRDLGNGTPLADAAAIAIALDARTASVGRSEVLALTDDDLLGAADEVHRQINKSAGAPRALPFGALLPNVTGLSIREHVLFPEAGRPGLHLFGTLREDAYGSNLERLAAMIELRTCGQPYRAMGLPTPSSVGDIGMRHNLDFSPLAEAGGVAMRHRISQSSDDIFCTLMPKDLERLADDITKAMAYLWVMQRIVGKRVDEVRSRVEFLLASAHKPTCLVSLRLVAYDWADDEGEDSDSPNLQVEYNALDDALRPGSVLQQVHGNMDCQALRVDHYWENRSRRRAELIAQGAVGYVDELAAAIVRAAPEGEQAVLYRLSTELDTYVTLPCGEDDIRVNLSWTDGRIRAHFRGPLIRTGLDGFEVRAVLPLSFMAAALGRSMSTLVELPFAFDGVIETVEDAGDGWLRFTFVQKWLLIDGGYGSLRTT